ncbi:hypothetical protein BASA81_008688 [Batrachochytrium salamandrivorans]|nr:hypothetical protein BASA81_008688 [Batrachochytrium salamandrivorans]
MNSLAHDSKYKKTLDVMDEVRAEIQSTTGDSKFVHEAMNHIPQIIVTGAQSSGKSSVLTQLSGVKLPQKAERCTRVAILLKLRREAAQPLTITLTRPNASAEVLTDVSDTANAIDKLQQTALSESGQEQFAHGYSVEVSAIGPDKANATLVDLPGFTSTSEEDTQLVKDIVLPLLQMDNTTVLHVCKGDTDYGSLLGNDIVRPYRDKIISVFTNFDRLAPNQRESVMKTIILGTNSPRFAIMGNYEGEPENEQEHIAQFAAFEGFETEFSYGRLALIEHMEKLQTERLMECLPAAITSLQGMLHGYQERAKLIESRPTVKVILEAIGLPMDRFQKNSLTYHCAQKELIEGFTMEMSKIGLVSYGNEGLSSRKLYAGEMLAPGDVVEVLESGEPAIVASTQIRNSMTYYQLDCGQEVHGSQLHVYEDEKEAVLESIHELASKNAGLRNLINVDPHQILEPFLLEYSTKFANLANEFCTEFAAASKEYLDTTVFSNDGVSDMAQPVLKEIQRLVHLEFDRLIKKCALWIADTQEWNHAPMVFTTNDHYLDALLQRMLKEEEKGVLGQVKEAHPLLMLYYRLRAYIKVQRKVLTEATVKQIGLTFNCHLERRIQHVIDILDLDKAALLVHEPKGWSRERELLQRRCGVLHRALAKLREIQA